MTRKKTPTPLEEAPEEDRADIPADETVPGAEDVVTASQDGETAPVPEKVPAEPQDGDIPQESDDLPDDSTANDMIYEDAAPSDPPVDGASGSETGTPKDADGGDSQFGALLQEMGSAAPLLVGDGPEVPLDNLLAGDSLTDVLPEAVPATPKAETGGSPEALPVAARQPAAAEGREDYVLTIEARSHIQTEQEQQEIVWHELRNSHIAGRILTGTLDGVEQTESGLTIVVVDYKGFRVAIPLKEMMLYSGPELHGSERVRLMDRLNRILVTMMGAEIDFIVRGIDANSRSVVASRKGAMLRKRQTFYMDTNELGETMIYEGRVVQARVIGVAEKVLRVEVFGVECPIFARDLSWTWFGDARDQYSVGDRVLVRVLTIDRKNLNDISITADVRSVSSATSQEALKKIVVQSRYAGRVTDVRNGVVFIRLNNGVNAIAHTCYDRRMPGKKDDVSFAVTRLDEERGIALGIITRIIKQNL